MARSTRPSSAPRGNVIALGMHEFHGRMRECAVLDSNIEVDEGIVTLEYDAAERTPTIRAAEAATLLVDPYLAALLTGCKNMAERVAVLAPLAREGYTVNRGWMDPAPEPEPKASEPAAEPVEPPAGFDPSDFVTSEQMLAAIASSERHIGERFDHIAEQINSLRPTVVQVGSREPVTFEPGELVHEATAEVIEDMEDDLHVYLTGEPGVGKSRMAATIAKSFGFTPEQTHFFSVSDMDQKNSLLGFTSPVTGEFIPGPLYWSWKPIEGTNHGHFSFLDELDAGRGAAMNALNAALDSPYLTFPNGETLKRPERVFILGAGNTTGKGGDMMFMRNQMDSATRNRWVFHHVDYDRNIERAIVTGILDGRADAWLTHCWGVRDRLEGERVVFSTRNIVAGAKMIARGRDMQTIVERALLPGESADIVRKSGALAFRG